MRRLAAAILLALGGCAIQPAAPVPEIPVRAPQVAPNIVGEWTAAAIDGVPVVAANRFPLTITRTTITASLCNMISGDYRLDGSRLAHAGPWRNTERGCFDPTGQRDPMATEERVFALLSSPLTVTTPSPYSLKLTGPHGTIDFVRGSPLSHIIVGEWTAVAFDERPAAAADRFALTVTSTWLRASLCNDIFGHYRLVDRRIEAVGRAWPWTERGCHPPQDHLEKRAWSVLGAWMSPTITMLGPDRMRITTARGSIDFERRR